MASFVKPTDYVRQHNAGHDDAVPSQPLTGEVRVQSVAQTETHAREENFPLALKLDCQTWVVPKTWLNLHPKSDVSIPEGDFNWVRQAWLYMARHHQAQFIKDHCSDERVDDEGKCDSEYDNYAATITNLAAYYEQNIYSQVGLLQKAEEAFYQSGRRDDSKKYLDWILDRLFSEADKMAGPEHSSAHEADRFLQQYTAYYERQKRYDVSVVIGFKILDLYNKKTVKMPNPEAETSAISAWKNAVLAHLKDATRVDANFLSPTYWFELRENSEPQADCTTGLSQTAHHLSEACLSIGDALLEKASLENNADGKKAWLTLAETYYLFLAGPLFHHHRAVSPIYEFQCKFRLMKVKFLKGEHDVAVKEAIQLKLMLLQYPNISFNVAAGDMAFIDQLALQNKARPSG